MTETRTEKEEQYIDLAHVIAVLWKHVVGILFTGMVFAALLFGYARFFVTPKYEANALFYVNNSSFSLSDAMAITTGELSAASDLVDTYVAILQSRANMELVLEKSGANYTIDQLRQMITAEPVNSTGLFRVIVTSTNPEEARNLANTIASILPNKISDIVANSSVELVDYAVTPHKRVSPSYIKYAAVGLLLGMMLHSAIVLLRDWMDDVIHAEDHLLQKYPYPVLATIPDLTVKSARKYGYGYYGSAARKGGVS